MKPFRTRRVPKDRTGDTFAERISFSGDDFDDLETAAKLKFNADQRTEIEKRAQQYASDCYGYARFAEAEKARVAEERRALEALGRTLQRAKSQIETIKDKHPDAARQLLGAEVARSNESAQCLDELQERCEQLRRRRRRTPPSYPILWKLLRGLEQIFRDAGGTTTGVHRGRAPRRGPFPDFCKFGDP
jgi:hypothetical protein